MQGCLDGVGTSATSGAGSWIDTIHKCFLQPVLQWFKPEGPVAVTVFEVMDIRSASIDNGWLRETGPDEHRRQQCASEYTDFVMHVTGVPRHVIVRTVQTADCTDSIEVQEEQGVLHLGLLYDIGPDEGVPDHPAQLTDMISDFFSSPTKYSRRSLCFQCIQQACMHYVTLTVRCLVNDVTICVQV